ncbi:MULTISPECIES: N-acetylmuramoyl-L-alanine amidase [unclassified Virgibacillus]|uniref:N-acetylmuramoyl-L-alanine amidase n=1 Tax=unclassified Virgibacillus TaxID=2620237 RepID=UPI0024DE09FA|nr:N-acetylmuramoyl-L-alanine amidase [Virgibacillus sp. LDC-1]
MARKINLWSVLLIGLIASLFSTTVYADEAIIMTDHLNVREGPGTQFEVITKVHTNEKYTILNEDGEWIEIQLAEKTGWVTKEYTTIQPEKKANAPTNQDMQSNEINVIYDHTQIREAPSTTSEINYFVDKGTKLKVIDEQEEWLKVKGENGEGYLHKALVEETSFHSSKGLKNKVIIIDAGHGGRDVGALGAKDSIEKSMTMRTAQELAQELTTLGAEVILVRSRDEYISLASRTSLSNIMNTDAFISLHYNSFPEAPSVTGIGTYFYHTQNQALASFVQKELINETTAKDRGTAFADFQVLRQNLKPAILLELGFISNPEKEQLLQTNAYQKKLVKGIVSGLERYFSR